MTRNLKALGLALFAICAMGALAAQGAAAAVEHEFHSDGERTVITGHNIEGEDAFAVGSAGTVKCEKTQTESTQVGTKVTETTWKSDQLTVVPHYTNCTFGGKAATVNFNHCAYVFDSDTTTGNSDGGEHAFVEVECAAGSRIEIDTSLCTITVAAQVIPDAVNYTNDTTTSVKVKTTAKKVVTGKEKTTEAQTGCVLFPTGAIGTYTGTSTTECFKDIGSPLSGTDTTTPTEKTVESEAKTECKVS